MSRKRDYPKEIEEAAQRMRKYPECLRSARSSPEWQNFLLEVVGVNPSAVESKSGQNFWNDVREKIYTRQAVRREIYQAARQAGMSATTARRIRDWSRVTAEDAIEKWQAKY